MSFQLGTAARWRGVLRFFRVASYLSIVPAAAFFLIEQQAARQAARVEAAHSLMLQANSGEISILASKLNAPWIEPEYVKFRDAKPSFVANEAMKDLLLKKHEISISEILRLANFYEVVLLCKDSETCDSGVVDAYFGADIKQYACFFMPQIEEIRKRVRRADTLTLVTRYAGDCES